MALRLLLLMDYYKCFGEVPGVRWRNLSNSQIVKELELAPDSDLGSGPHQGISKEKLPLNLAFFLFIHNTRKLKKSLLNSLVE